MSVEKSGGKMLQFHPELKMILVLNAVLHPHREFGPMLSRRTFATNYKFVEIKFSVG